MLSSTQRRLLFGTVITISTALLINAGFHLGIFEELEWRALDLQQRLFYGNDEPPQDIAVILIDEASLRVMNPLVGRWPWPRSVHSDVIDFLFLGGAKAVLFDILFTENEKTPGESTSILGPNDHRLVEATASSGNIYHAAQLIIDREDEYNKGLLNKPLPDDFVTSFSVKNIAGVIPEGNNNYYLPFPELYRASKGVGVVEFSPDRDGVYRRTRLFRHYQGSFFPVLSTAPLLNVLRIESVRMEKGKLILLPHNISIPIQGDGSYMIKMYGNFKPYSMSGILSSVQKIKLGEIERLPVDPAAFKDRIVFIGASAVGVEDLKATPLNSMTPGVYLHASVYGNIIQKDFLMYRGPLLTSFLILALSITVSFTILYIRNALYQTGLPVVLSILYVSVSLWQFKSNIVYDIIAPIASIAISWMTSFAYLSLTEGKDKRRIKRMLEQYVSPAMLATVIEKSPQDVLKAEVGSKEYLTILFSDIREFTTLSESLDAEKVVEILNSYLSEMVDVIFRYEGTLDKFIGDAIMAFWGAPVKVNDHGERAVQSAIEMMQSLKILNDTIKKRGGSPLEIGIGINSGEVILGNIGSEKKLDYTVIGDNVNLASRVEGLTKEYGCHILITETTYQEVKKSIPCRVVDIVRVKGKKRGIRIYEPLNARVKDAEILEKIISISEEGFNHYLNRRWADATNRYSMLLSIKPNDPVAEIFINRCMDYIGAEPPENWDGVYTMFKK